MKTTIVLIKQLIVLMLYGLSFLVPRHRRIWVFGSREGLRYNDNSRHVFEYVCKKIPSIRAVWLTRIPDIVEDLRRAGRESYLVDSWQAYWLSCRAGIVIASHHKIDICYYAISRAIKINLWHGCPLKKIFLDWPDSNAINYLFHPEIPFYRIDLKTNQIVDKLRIGLKWDNLISTSPVFSKRMASGFGVDIHNVRITGYPRNDMLLHKDIKRLPFIDSLKARLKADKIILYAPTWRKDDQEQIRLFDTFDWERVSSFLRQHNTLLITKMHFMNREVYHDLHPDEVSYIYWLNEEDCPEFNYLLPYADVLITDFSGAYFDYLLLDRPIIFTPFDLDEYVTEWGFYENYNEATPGPKCFTWGEVMERLQEILSGDDQYKELRKLALKKYHTFADDNSCRRVADYAMELARKRKLF